MAYSTKLESMIEASVSRRQGLEKKRMFGGVGYLLKGNMCFGIWKDFLIVRMDKDLAMEKLKEKNTKPFDITGRPMAGWVMVSEEDWKRKAGLAKWLAIAEKFAASLPEKKTKAKKKKTLRDYKA